MEPTSFEAVEVLHCDVLDSLGSKGLTEQHDSPFVGLVQLQCNSFNSSLVLLGYLERIVFLAFLEFFSL